MQAKKFDDIPQELLDPFRHAYMSAYEAFKYGNSVAQVVGDWREGLEVVGTMISSPLSTHDKTQKALNDCDVDFHNSHVGRRIGSWARNSGLSWEQTVTVLARQTKLTGSDKKIPL